MPIVYSPEGGIDYLASGFTQTGEGWVPPPGIERDPEGGWYEVKTKGLPGTWRDYQAQGLWTAENLLNPNSPIWNQYYESPVLPVFRQGEGGIYGSQQNFASDPWKFAQHFLSIGSDDFYGKNYSELAEALKAAGITDPNYIREIEGSITARQQASSHRDFFDRLESFIMPALSLFFSAVTSGFGMGSTAAGPEGGAMDMGIGEAMGASAPQTTAQTLTGTGAAAAAAENATTSIASQLAGAPTTAKDFLLASAPGQTVTDVSAGLLNAGGTATPAIAPLPDASAITGFGGGMDPAAIAGTNFVAPSSGIIGGVMGDLGKWVKENKELVAAGAPIVGGIMSGIGQSMLLDRKIQADKEAQAQRLADEQALEEWKRRFIQGGSYFDAPIPMRASGNVLRRPDGTPVYQGTGLIAGAMNG